MGTENYMFCGMGALTIQTEQEAIYLYGHVQNVLQRGDNRLKYAFPSFLSLALAWRQTLEKAMERDKGFSADVPTYLESISEKLQKLTNLHTTLKNPSKLKYSTTTLEAPEDERKILELIVDFKSNWE